MSILVFGEIVWDDITPQGGSGQAANLGGAPLNVAAHCAKMGMQADIFSALGEDCLGDRALYETNKLGVGAAFISRVPQSTCLITVTFDSAGNPSYHIPRDVSWDHIGITERQLQAIQKNNYDFFYFGSLHLRSPESFSTAKTLLKSGRFRHTYCDINLRFPHYSKDVLDFCLSNCETAKINRDELDEICRLFQIPGIQLHEKTQNCAAHFGLKNMLVTMGSCGAAFLCGREFGQVPGISVTVADTVGAGDAFSAGLLSALEQGRAFGDACISANLLGSFIATKTSSIPPYSREEFEAWRRAHV